MPARTTAIARSDSRRRFIVAIATFLLVSVLVIRTSDAAFTAEHVNEDNAFTTAEIDLDSAVTVPLFGEGPAQSLVDATNMIPETPVSACIDIDYAGTLDAADLDSVLLTIDGPAGDLADGLNVTVDLYDECGGTLDTDIVDGALYSSDTDTTWTPATDGDSRGFLFTVELDDDDDLQGESLTGVDITWTLETS